MAPPRVMEAMSVWFLPRFLGTLPYARSPLGALALRRVIEVWKPDSSTNTSRLASRSGSPATSKAPAPPPPRAQRLRETFFERPATRQARDRPADSGSRDCRAFVGLLERLTVFVQREVGVSLQEVSGQSHPSSATPFTRGRPGIGLGSTSPVSRRCRSQRLMVGTDTEKVLAASSLPAPRSTAASTRLLRSFE